MANSITYSYLYFQVKGFTGTETLSSYSLDITPLTFIPDLTTVGLLSSATFATNKYLMWDFGDGTTSNELTATHYYKWPGTYEVKLSFFDNSGRIYRSTYVPRIQVFNFIADDLIFQDYGKFIYDVPASKIIDPLVILRRNSYQTFDSLTGNNFTINLYASGAYGDYINSEVYYNDQWAHLRALSRFYIKETIGRDTSYTIVDKVSTIDTDIYARINNNALERCNKDDIGSVFAGTTGYAEIYYVDDRAKNFTTRDSPVYIFATLDNATFNDEFTFTNNLYDFIPRSPEGFQSIKPAVQPIIKIRHNPASYLSITTNGIDGEGALSTTKFQMPGISWQNTEIPFVIKMKDSENYSTRTYPPLLCSNNDSTTPATTAFNLQIDLIALSGSTTHRIADALFYSDFPATAPQSVGSFYKGYFVPQSSNYTCKLTAGMNIIDPINFPKDSLLGWICEPDYKYLKRIFKTSIYNSCFDSATVTISSYNKDFRTPNSPNSYCLAVAPSGAGLGNDYQAWVGDGSVDKIYKIDVFGSILSSFPLSSYPVEALTGVEYRDLRSTELSSSAPNSIAIDGKNNIWISLFDAVSCIKISGTTGNMLSIAYPSLTNIVYALSSTYTLPELSGFAGENILLPASIDTDYESNLWVAYTHPVSNFLIKYNTDGVPLVTVPLPSLFSPVEIIVDRDEYVWLTVLNNIENPPNINDRYDFVYKFDKDGNIVFGYPIGGLKLVGNITVDGNQNAYVSNSINTITKIDGTTGEQTEFIAGRSKNLSNYICDIGGIAADTGDYLWVINNSDNKLYYFDLLTESIPTVADASFTDLTFPQADDPTNPLSGFSDKLFQAYGDWNGARWINKYMVPVTVTRYISGESNTFSIFSDKGEYNIQKINENFDASSFYNNLRYQETLLDKTVFFNEFLKTIVGDLSAQPYELGKTVYEKIANFTSNISDVNKCNLNQLLSFCDELGVQFEQYNYPYPPQLRRIVDMLSIKQRILYGSKNTYDRDFNKKFTVNPNIGRNLGNQISSLSGVITSGIPIIAYEKFSNIYTLVNTNQFVTSALSSTRPLSTYNYNWGWGLVVPRSLSGDQINNFYEFYEYRNIPENSFYNNIIDWKNPMTKLNPNSPASLNNQDWVAKDGIMQNILSYELTKGLKLFTSAANIQYNN